MKLESDTYPSPNHHKIIHQNHNSPTAQEKKKQKNKKKREQKRQNGKNPRDVIILDFLSKDRASFIAVRTRILLLEGSPALALGGISPLFFQTFSRERRRILRFGPPS